jgi:hypothetical protein
VPVSATASITRARQNSSKPLAPRPSAVGAGQVGVPQTARAPRARGIGDGTGKTSPPPA